MDFTIDDIKSQAKAAVNELFDNCAEDWYKLERGDIVVVGCSTSRILGYTMGKHSSEDVAAAVMDVILPQIRKRGLYLACQCCEHLNRALVVERECMDRYGLTQVCVKPALHAGGAWSVSAMNSFDSPVVVEELMAKARAGIDIGGVFIGMHMRPVVVPIHNVNVKIGNANVTMARTRPKLIGGERAQYR